MSGYLAVCVDGSPKPGLTCCHCKRLLRNPVQTEEGQRLCRGCFDHIKSLPGGSCSDCEVELTTEDSFYPDKAVQREVLALPVYCKYKSNGCQWQGLLKKWEDHIAGCEFKGVPCPHEGCGQSFKPSALEEHVKECGYRLINCDHCSTSIRFIQKKKHEDECEEMLINCDEESCSATFKRKELNMHKEKDCAVINCVTCGVKVTRDTGMEVPPKSNSPSHDDLLPSESSTSAVPKRQNSQSALLQKNSRKTSTCRGMSRDDDTSVAQLPEVQSSTSMGLSMPGTVHLSDPVQNFHHHQILALKIQDVENNVDIKLAQQESSTKELASIKQSNERLLEDKIQLQKELSSVKTEVSDIRNMMKDLTRQLSTQKNTDHDKLLLQVQELQKADKEKSETLEILKIKLEELRNDLKKNDSITPMGSFGRVETDNIRSSISRKGVGAMELRGHTALSSGYESSNFQQMRQMEEFRQQLGMMRVQLTELELQLQASLASTYNGNFLWRIPDVTRRRRDAIDGHVTSIYSPPFYTGRNGYKMCIRGYLNGDGMGYQSHLSLFFVIMRGECDPLLKWPFEYKVSMILVDQTHRKHIVQTFKPTPESNSFQQPKTEMNVASGCPQFAKLNVLDDPSYVKDDIMFIKCIVDTTKIFHP